MMEEAPGRAGWLIFRPARLGLVGEVGRGG